MKAGMLCMRNSKKKNKTIWLDHSVHKGEGKYNKSGKVGWGQALKNFKSQTEEIIFDLKVIWEPPELNK